MRAPISSAGRTLVDVGAGRAALAVGRAGGGAANGRSGGKPVLPSPVWLTPSTGLTGYRVDLVPIAGGPTCRLYRTGTSQVTAERPFMPGHAG